MEKTCIIFSAVRIQTTAQDRFKQLKAFQDQGFWAHFCKDAPNIIIVHVKTDLNTEHYLTHRKDIFNAYQTYKALAGKPLPECIDWEDLKKCSQLFEVTRKSPQGNHFHKLPKALGLFAEVPNVRRNAFGETVSQQVLNEQEVLKPLCFEFIAAA